ncbi:hypothetical protein PUN28_008078 [Cardiocondyla obscurior]|uniref:Uncharacterized protein n=1 Tax=Cardiocondyla obscurior TaxID=286306 RepID=A0AAW2FZ81_9HYME
MTSQCTARDRNVNPPLGEARGVLRVGLSVTIRRHLRSGPSKQSFLPGRKKKKKKKKRSHRLNRGKPRALGCEMLRLKITDNVYALRNSRDNYER